MHKPPALDLDDLLGPPVDKPKDKKEAPNPKHRGNWHELPEVRAFAVKQFAESPAANTIAVDYHYRDGFKIYGYSSLEVICNIDDDDAGEQYSGFSGDTPRLFYCTDNAPKEPIGVATRAFMDGGDCQRAKTMFIRRVDLSKQEQAEVAHIVGQHEGKQVGVADDGRDGVKGDAGDGGADGDGEGDGGADEVDGAKDALEAKAKEAQDALQKLKNRLGGNGEGQGDPPPMNDLEAWVRFLANQEINKRELDMLIDYLGQGLYAIMKDLEKVKAHGVKAALGGGGGDGIVVNEIVIKDRVDAEKVVNLKEQHKQFPVLLDLCSQRLPVWLAGPAGSGKSMAAYFVAKALEVPFHSQSMGPQTTKSDLMGYRDAGGTYHDTELRRAFENGGIFLADEIDASNAGVLTMVNQLLANGRCAFPDKMVEAHPDFIFIGAANTWGTGATAEYVGRNRIDAATLDRFMFLPWDYDEGLETKIAGDKNWSKRVQRIRKCVHKHGIKTVVSPRASINGAKLLAIGMPMEQVEQLIIWKNMSSEQITKIKSEIGG